MDTIILMSARYRRRIRKLMKRRIQRAGQVATEFVVVAGMVLATVSIVALLLYTFKEYGGRILNLLASEYP